MRRYIIPILFFVSLTASIAQAADAIGFREITLPDPGGTRPLHAVIWYPAADDSPQTIVGDNPAITGLSVIKDARTLPGPHPLVVMSHGYGGTWRNLNWLAGELVRRGYVVAAPDHPGTTTFDRRPSEAARLWERPHDLSRVIDALIADPALTGGVQAGRIAAIGHSLGGWTVAGIAGGRFSSEQMARECQANPGLRACALTAEFGIDQAATKGQLEGSLADARVGAVISLDLGLARGFTPESLGTVKVPVLTIAAGTDIGGLPAKLESGYLAQHLPATTSRYIEIADATHFSFMGICKPGAAVMIEEETPGDGIVCRDGGTRDREAIHEQVAGLVIDFLAKALPVGE
ncbi:alpha/beta fold hydrolase [Phyllobacterium sp. 628]|uniref:alpha/beta hydrolase family protein n=1 Tax=Phyllobacterium sp. 628 TaxID=2718938 RepID=UPI001AEED5EA|nr:alpha/beta fold hydrolase [Phyllobacterium sp. 628]